MTIRERIAAAVGGVGKLKERVMAPVALRSYGVEDNESKMFFVQARGFKIKKGRLLFKARGRLVAAVEAGEWKRVLEGIALEDFEK